MTRLASNGKMFGSEWEAAVCGSALWFGRMRACVLNLSAMFYYTLRFMADQVISTMD